MIILALQPGGADILFLSYLCKQDGMTNRYASAWDPDGFAEQYLFWMQN